jgi:ABC-2 type transport system permease protein
MVGREGAGGGRAPEVELTPPGATRDVVTVARREFVERVRERTFLISTLVTIILLLGITVLPRLLGLGGPDSWTVGLVGGGSAALAEPVTAAASATGAELTIERPADAGAATARVRDGDLDLAVVDGQTVIVGEDPSGTLIGLVQAAARQARLEQALTGAGVPEATARQALTVPPLEVRSLDPSDDAFARNVARFGVILLYIQLLIYGIWVASGVVEEKQTRIVEILLAAVRPLHLLTGKVIGIGLLGLFQLVILAAVAIVGTQVSGQVEAPAGILWPAALVTFWFILGYALFSCLFAAVGSLVSRQEELQNAIQPLNIIFMISYLVGFFATFNPNDTLARVVSFVPTSAPLVMPARIVSGAPLWEVLLSIAITLGSAAVLVPIAARVYRGAILRSGARVKFAQALRGG